MMDCITYYDFMLGVPMFLLLFLAAWSDNHGAEVPDATTVPYAILGCCASIFHARYITAIVAGIIAILVLQPWRPRWLLKLNAWIVNRAYHGDTMQQEEESTTLSNQADTFHSQHENTLLLCVAFVWALMMGATLLNTLFGQRDTNTSRFAFLIVYASFLLLFLYILSEYLRGKRQGIEAMPTTDDIPAIGGADILIFAGMLGYYGVIPFLFGLTISLLAYVLFLGCVWLIRKHQAVGTPLLPALCVMAPVRLLLAITVCPPIIQTYAWFMTHF